MFVEHFQGVEAILLRWDYYGVGRSCASTWRLMHGTGIVIWAFLHLWLKPPKWTRKVSVCKKGFVIQEVRAVPSSLSVSTSQSQGLTVQSVAKTKVLVLQYNLTTETELTFG